MTRRETLHSGLLAATQKTLGRNGDLNRISDLASLVASQYAGTLIPENDYHKESMERSTNRRMETLLENRYTIPQVRSRTVASIGSVGLASLPAVDQ